MPTERTEWMLTTIDNPFDPFTQYAEWNVWDLTAGYNTNNLLARIALVSPEYTEADQGLALDQAMDEIVSINASGMHKKVSKTFSE